MALRPVHGSEGPLVAFRVGPLSFKGLLMALRVMPLGQDVLGKISERTRERKRQE